MACAGSGLAALFCLLGNPATSGAVTAAAEAALTKARFIYTDHRNVRLAEESLLLLIASEPEYLEAYLLLGRIYVETRRVDEAFEVTAQGLEHFAGNLDLLLLRGRILLMQGREDEADGVRERMEEVSARSPQGLWLAVLLHYRRGEREEETKLLEEALGSSRPDPGPVLRDMMVRELASAYEELGRIGEARERFLEFVTAKPSDSGRVQSYVRFLSRHKIGAEDLESYGRRLAEGPPPSPGAYLFLGEGLLMQDRPDEALLAASDGMARGGPRGGLELLAARACLALGYRDAALARAEAAEIAGTSPKEVEEIRRAAAEIEPVPYRGPRLTVEPDHLVVGTVEDGDRVTAALTLGNDGKETLHLRDLWIMKVPGKIVDVGFPSREIPPGEHVEGIVTVFGRRGPIELAGELNLQSNDLMEPRRIVTVEARISAPLLAVFEVEPPNPAPVGEVAWGSEVVREFVLRNSGNIPMRIRDVSTAVSVSWEGLAEREILPGGEESLLVRWRVPEKEGDAVTVLSFFIEGTEKEVNQVTMTAVVAPKAAGEEKQ